MEAPRADLQLQDMSSVCELANSILARVDCVEEAVKSAEEQLSEAVSQLSPDAWKFQNKEEFRKEMRRAMIPSAVLSLKSRKLHHVQKASCIDPNPRLWTTECGW